MSLEQYLGQSFPPPPTAPPTRNINIKSNIQYPYSLTYPLKSLIDSSSVLIVYVLLCLFYTICQILLFVVFIIKTPLGIYCPQRVFSLWSGPYLLINPTSSRNSLATSTGSRLSKSTAALSSAILLSSIRPASLFNTSSSSGYCSRISPLIITVAS